MDNHLVSFIAIVGCVVGFTFIPAQRTGHILLRTGSLILIALFASTMRHQSQGLVLSLLLAWIIASLSLHGKGYLAAPADGNALPYHSDYPDAQSLRVLAVAAIFLGIIASLQFIGSARTSIMPNGDHTSLAIWALSAALWSVVVAASTMPYYLHRRYTLPALAFGAVCFVIIILVTYATNEIVATSGPAQTNNPFMRASAGGPYRSQLGGSSPMIATNVAVIIGVILVFTRALIYRFLDAEAAQIDGLEIEA